MAVSKLTTWNGRHRLDGQSYNIQRENYIDQGVVFHPSYAVYADMANGNSQPYIRLNGCRFRHISSSNSTIRAMLPISVRIQINGTGTTYSFSSGSTIKTVSNYVYNADVGIQYNEYTVTFSSSTDVPIPRNGQEFTLNITLITNNGQTVSVTESACSPMSNSISGSSSIQTGRVSTFALSRALKNDEHYHVNGILDYYFQSSGSAFSTIPAYTSEYCRIDHERNSFTEFKFLPLRGNATIGEKAVANKGGHNFIELSVYYHTLDVGFGDAPLGGGSFPGGNETSANALLITRIVFPVTIVSRSAVDASLRPVFSRASKINAPEFDEHVTKYGSAVQNNTPYQLCVFYNGSVENQSTQTPYPPYYYNEERLKYGSWFQYYVLRITVNGVTKTVNGTFGAFLNNTYFRNDPELLTEAGHYEISLTLTDSLGFESVYTENFDVIAYSVPRLTQYRARRCSVVGGGGSNTWIYNGVYYKLDDYGEYALIEWGVNITSLNNKNSKSLTINDPQRIDAGSAARSVTLPAYVCSGYYVTAANPDKSYDVLFTVQDDFHVVALAYPLNTILAIIDFLSGGDGVALGKVAEERDTFDIHRNWLLKMPYDTMVQGYTSNGGSVRLRDWMTTTANRIQSIIDSRDWMIIDGTKVYDNNTAVCIPSNYGTMYDAMRYSTIGVIPNANRVVGLTLSNAINVNRNYLNFTFDVSGSFAGQGWDTVKYYPTIYLLSTKPTTINQTTGVPNGTILTSRQIGDLRRYGSYDDGYQAWTISWMSCYFNVTSYRGSNIYIVITCAQGGASPSGYYTYDAGRIGVNKIALSNTAISG